jgi:hypothetical protein
MHTVSLACVKQALAMRKHGWCVKFSSKSCSVGYADVRRPVRSRTKPKAG